MVPDVSEHSWLHTNRLLVRQTMFLSTIIYIQHFFFLFGHCWTLLLFSFRVKYLHNNIGY